MKSNEMNGFRGETVDGTTFGSLCLRSCEKILAQIRKAKEAIFAESRATVAARERILRLALNEAEALAWQTAYPHLVFPALAMEKVQEVADWNQHQRFVRQTEPLFALAA